MPRVNKIVQYGLEDEVIRLKNSGMSQHAISEYLNSKHNEVNLSVMAVNRYLNSQDLQEIQNKLKANKDPEEELRTEFREQMYELDDEVHILLKKCNKLIKEAEKSDNLRLKLDTIKQTANIIEQIRRNWSTFVDQGFNRFEKVNEAKEINYVMSS